MTKQYLESLIGPEKINQFRKVYEDGRNWDEQIESTDFYNLWTKIIDDDYINYIGPQPLVYKTPTKGVAHIISPKNGQNNNFLNNFKPQPKWPKWHKYTFISIYREKAG